MNVSKYKKYQKEYAHTHKEEKCKYVKEFTRMKRKAALELLGNKCIRCQFNDFRALQIDHINGGGSKERKSMTTNYYTAVIKSILNNENKYQLLCANCNWIKRYENKEVISPKYLLK